MASNVSVGENRPAKKRFKVVLIVLLLLFVVLVMGAEAYLRVTAKHKLARWVAMEYEADMLLGYRYLPDTTFVISNIAFTNTCRTNSFGFPLPHFSRQKSEGVYRVLLIGNSDDTGFNSDGGYSYVMRLNDMFKERGWRVEVVNCSTDGDDRIAPNISFLYSPELLSYEPDLVLLKNDLPIKRRMRYRETHRGYLIYSHRLDGIAPVRGMIDESLVNKRCWFRMYDASYIFRYYMKVYFDMKKERKQNSFVKYTEKFFSGYTLKSLELYVRRMATFWPKLGFRVDMYEMDRDYRNDSVMIADSRRVGSFPTGTEAGEWVSADLTAYMRDPGRRGDTLALMLYTSGGKMRDISFASSRYRGDMRFAPRLRVAKDGDEVVLLPDSDGFVFGPEYMPEDTLMSVKNTGNPELNKIGFVKFGINGLEHADSARLDMYVVHLRTGYDIFDDKEFTLSESADIIMNLKTYLEDNGIKMLLFDTYNQPVNYTKSFRVRGVEYVPLNIHMEEEYSFGAVDGHSTQKGHQAIAGRMLALLAGVIPEEYMK